MEEISRTTSHGGGRRPLPNPQLASSSMPEDEYEDIVADPSPHGPGSREQCDGSFLDPSNIWIEFEAVRSSAEYHVAEYLRYLAQSRSPANGGEISQEAQNIIIIRLKIARDSVIRDLLIMENILSYSAALRNPPKVSSTAALCTLTTGMAAVVNHAKAVVLFSQFAFVASAVTLAVPPAWNWYQTRNHTAAHASVEQLRRAFESDINSIDDTSRRTLKQSNFTFLRRAHAY